MIIISDIGCLWIPSPLGFTITISALHSGYSVTVYCILSTSLLPSLEYLLHSALNSNDSSFLTATLQLLSHIPQFTHLLVRCLRKQERSTWPFAVHDASDILRLFHSFLLKDDLEYAVTTISILQGLHCRLNEKNVVVPEDPKENQMQSLSQLFPKELEWVPYHFSEVFKENSEVDCIAHRSGLQLLFVALVRERYELLQDVYRFLEMEVWVNKVAEF